jgi:hypothetical protein
LVDNLTPRIMPYADLRSVRSEAPDPYPGRPKWLVKKLKKKLFALNLKIRRLVLELRILNLVEKKYTELSGLQKINFLFFSIFFFFFCS